MRFEADVYMKTRGDVAAATEDEALGGLSDPHELTAGGRH